MAKEPSKAFRLVDEMEQPAPVKARAASTCPSRVPRKDKGAEGEASRRHVEPPMRMAPPPKPTEEDPVPAAVNRAVSLLEYGDMSRRRLVRKLTDRGIDPEVAEQAADVLEEKGYLRESDACRRRAEQGVRKLWGSRRIAEDLYAQRYPRAIIEQVMCELEDEVDFTESCIRVITKKYHGVPEDRDDRRRMTAALARLGYGMDEIRAAMTAVAEEASGD